MYASVLMGYIVHNFMHNLTAYAGLLLFTPCRAMDIHTSLLDARERESEADN